MTFKLTPKQEAAIERANAAIREAEQEPPDPAFRTRNWQDKLLETGPIAGTGVSGGKDGKR